LKAIKINLKLTDRGIHIPDNYRQAFEAMVDFCKEKRGGYIFLTLAPPRKPRSTGPGSQNHAINGYCQQIAAATGNTFEDVKKYAKQQAVSEGYPILEDKEGNAILDMWGNANGISEVDATMEDAAILIKTIMRIADEEDIKLIC
jgi:hypothetical protein